MKANELFEQIHSRKIKEETKIKVINKLTGNWITTISYKNGRLNWQAGEFDTSFLCNIDIDFKVIEENKEIEELNKISYDEFKHTDTKHRFDLTNIEYDKINELVRAVNKINKDLEELEPYDIEVSERDINDAIKRAREYTEREEK